MFLWKLWLVFAIFTSSNHIGVQVTQKIVVRLSKKRHIQICNTSYQKLLNGLLKSTDKFCPVSVHDQLLMCIQKNFVEHTSNIQLKQNLLNSKRQSLNICCVVKAVHNTPTPPKKIKINCIQGFRQWRSQFSFYCIRATVVVVTEII